MVGIVKWSRPRVVAPVYVGSTPTTHPKFKNITFPSWFSEVKWYNDIRRTQYWGIAKR